MQKIVQETLLNGVGQFALAMSPAPRMIQNVFGDSEVGSALSLGHMQAIVIYVVDMLLTGQSRFNLAGGGMQGLTLYEDDAMFFSLANWVLSMVEADVFLAEMVRDVSPLSFQQNQALVMAIQAVTNNLMRDYLELMYSGNNYVYTALHPVTSAVQMAGI